MSRFVMTPEFVCLRLQKKIKNTHTCKKNLEDLKYVYACLCIQYKHTE